MRARNRSITSAAGPVVGAFLCLGALSPSIAFAAVEKCPNPGGTYPPGQCTEVLGVSAQTLHPGQAFQFSGSDFAQGSPASLDLHTATYHLGTFSADSSGHVNGTATIPTGIANGSHTLSLNGVDPQGRALLEAVKVTITGGSRAASGSLPFSGTTAVLPLTGAGVGMVLAGGLTVMTLRRRRPRLRQLASG